MIKDVKLARAVFQEEITIKINEVLSDCVTAKRRLIELTNELKGHQENFTSESKLVNTLMKSVGKAQECILELISLQSWVEHDCYLIIPYKKCIDPDTFEKVKKAQENEMLLIVSNLKNKLTEITVACIHAETLLTSFYKEE